MELNRGILGSLARVGAAAVCARKCEEAMSVFALVDLTRLDVEGGGVIGDNAMATVGVTVVRTGCDRGMLMERVRPSLSSSSSGWVSVKK